MKNHTDIRSKSRSTKKGFLGYKTPISLRAQKEEMKRLQAASQLIGGVFGELHNIQELIGLNAVAEVENLEEKIKKGYEKIHEHLNRYEQGEDLAQGQGLENQAAKRSSDAIPLEAHPELQDMGGMPLELDKIDKEFLQELGLSDLQDKAEIQNQIKKAKEKLQNRLKNALKFAAKLQNKIKNQPQAKPALKQANELVIKYKMALEDLKKRPVLQPEAPEYQPRYTPPKPRPMGGG